MGVFAPVVHRYDWDYGSFIRPMQTSEVSGQTLILGSDDRGNDVLVRALFGALGQPHVSGLISVGLSMAIGIPGGVSGYFGGWVDLVLQRVVEPMMTFPSFILVLVVVSIVGPDIHVIMVVFGLTGWSDSSISGEFLAQSGREYVLAGEAFVSRDDGESCFATFYRMHRRPCRFRRALASLQLFLVRAA